MQRFNFLYKKSLLFFLMALLGSQNLRAMDDVSGGVGINIDRGSAALGLVVGAVASFFAYLWGESNGKKEGKVGKEKALLEERTKHFREVQDLREKNFQELHDANMKIIDLKKPGFFENPKKMVGLVVGGVITGIVIYKGGQYLIKVYQNRKAKLKSEEFIEVDPQVKEMYKSMEEGIQEIEDLFKKVFREQKGEYLERLKELQDLLKEYKDNNNEKLIEIKIEWASKILYLYKELQEKIKDSILDEDKIGEICEIIDQQVVAIKNFTKSLKNQFPEKPKKKTRVAPIPDIKSFVEANFGPIIKNNDKAVKCAEGINKYNIILELCLTALKNKHLELYGEKMDSIEGKTLKTNPGFWYECVFETYGNLRKRVVKKKTILKKEGGINFHITKNDFDRNFYCFEEKYSGERFRNCIKEAGHKFDNISDSDPDFISVVKSFFIRKLGRNIASIGDTS